MKQFLWHDRETGECGPVEEDFGSLWWGRDWREVLSNLEEDAFGVLATVNKLEISAEWGRD